MYIHQGPLRRSCQTRIIPPQRTSSVQGALAQLIRRWPTADSATTIHTFMMPLRGDGRGIKPLKSSLLETIAELAQASSRPGPVRLLPPLRRMRMRSCSAQRDSLRRRFHPPWFSCSRTRRQCLTCA
ncbi:hypothetical protein AOLI_G00184140 [Acnodon oligacanthus]